MAISPTSLTSGTSATNSTSYATASISPTANRLVIVDVYGQALTAANAAAPSGISGAGLTFVKLVDRANTTNGPSLSRWYAMSASPSSGALTITFANTQANALWSVYELAGAETSGSNGANAVNGNTASAENMTGTVASVTATLAAFASANNGALCATLSIKASPAATCTPDTGWSEIHDINMTEGAFGFGLETQWRADNDTTAQGTWSANAAVMTIASEIIAATPATAYPWNHYQQLRRR